MLGVTYQTYTVFARKHLQKELESSQKALAGRERDFCSAATGLETELNNVRRQLQSLETEKESVLKGKEDLLEEVRLCLLKLSVETLSVETLSVERLSIESLSVETVSVEILSVEILSDETPFRSVCSSTHMMLIIIFLKLPQKDFSCGPLCMLCWC